MNITVKFFAVCHEMFGRREEQMELPDGAIVMDILKRLSVEKSEFSEYYNVMQISVNWEYANANTPLKDGYEVALIPPVTGG